MRGFDISAVTVKATVSVTHLEQGDILEFLLGLGQRADLWDICKILHTTGE